MILFYVSWDNFWKHVRWLCGVALWIVTKNRFWEVGSGNWSCKTGYVVGKLWSNQSCFDQDESYLYSKFSKTASNLNFRLINKLLNVIRIHEMRPENLDFQTRKKKSNQLFWRLLRPNFLILHNDFKLALFGKNIENQASYSLIMNYFLRLFITIRVWASFPFLFFNTNRSTDLNHFLTTQTANLWTHITLCLSFNNIFYKYLL